MSKYRSVIIKNDKVICYSPSKSINYYKFVEKYSQDIYKNVNCIHQVYLLIFLLNLWNL